MGDFNDAHATSNPSFFKDEANTAAILDTPPTISGF
jgi:hypothetical protein